MDVREQFGRILRDLRKAQGLTQEELAFRAEMNVTYLSDIERGRWNPSLAMLVDLARGLGLHPADLLKGLVIEPQDAPPTGRKRPKE
ncbi:MAG: helix-turn-helix transcriptional regulator [Alphaproteobacteria bacterium]|nr:helix-turn-helix transcriptional regulator [Alphaproteobacteria bacterium]